MSITIVPRPFTYIGDMITARLRWEGGTPNPTDAHIDAQHDDGSWHAVIDVSTIPDNTENGPDSSESFDIRFSSGNPNVGGPGDRHFRVRWTWDGKERDVTENPLTIKPGAFK